MDEEYSDITNILKESMKSYNELLIFANGNSGHVAPALISLLSYLDKGVKNNIIGVTALDILNKLKEDIEKYYDANKVMLRMYYLGFEEDRDYLVMKVKGKNFLKME